MDIFARLLTAIESQQIETLRQVRRRETQEASSVASPARMMAYDAETGEIIAATPTNGVVRGRSLTNARLSVGAQVGFFQGDVNFIDGPSVL